MSRISWTLALVAGCGDPRFDWALVKPDFVTNEVRVELVGPRTGDCPTLGDAVTAVVNGVRSGSWLGGGDDENVCDRAEMDFEAVPLDTGELHVTVEGKGHDVEVRGDWPAAHTLGTDDNLAAVLAADGTFHVTWSPADAVLGPLSVFEYDAEGEEIPAGVSLSQVSTGEGTAEFRLSGTPGGGRWGVVGSSVLERVPALCRGIDRCSFYSQPFVLIWESAPAPGK